MNLSEVIPELREDVMSMDAAGIVIILALEGAPMVIKVGIDDDHTRELCRIISTSEPITKQ